MPGPLTGRLICFISLFILCVFASHDERTIELELKTNGERMALGMPPLPPPHLARILNRRRKMVPTRLRGRQSAPSPTPSPILESISPWRRIRVTKNEDGAMLGYISRLYNGRVKAFGITQSETTALKVQYEEETSLLLIQRPVSIRHPYLGFVNSSDPNGFNHMVLGASYGGDNASLWSVEETQLIHRLHSHLNGDTPPEMVYSPRQDSITAVSNSSSFRTNQPDVFQIGLALA